MVGGFGLGFAISLCGLVLTSLSANAQYYTFSANTRSTKSWEEPQTLVAQAARSTIDLLSWVEHSGVRPPPSERYDRNKHFGSWIEEPNDEDCYDVRSEVLIRDSQVKVEFSKFNPCKVSAGRWTDPYSGQTFTMARDIEIDHVVALKNAYESGAWSWAPQVRCAFANFMGFKEHLIAASSAENQLKSDKGPERWMPSNQQYACQHLQNWLTIKLAWNLNMGPEETAAIDHYVQAFHCDLRNFQMSKSEMARIRRSATATLKNCQ